MKSILSEILVADATSYASNQTIDSNQTLNNLTDTFTKIADRFFSSQIVKSVADSQNNYTSYLKELATCLQEICFRSQDPFSVTVPFTVDTNSESNSSSSESVQSVLEQASPVDTKIPESHLHKEFNINNSIVIVKACGSIVDLILPVSLYYDMLKTPFNPSPPLWNS